MKKVFIILSLLMGLTTHNGAKGEQCSSLAIKIGCTTVDIASPGVSGISYTECSTGRGERQNLEGMLTLCVKSNSWVGLYFPTFYGRPYFMNTVSGTHATISCSGAFSGNCKLSQ